MSACAPTARTAERRRAAAGFTILELMIVASLMGIFFGTVYETVIVGLRLADAADERENIRQQLAHALELLGREAGVAANVDVAEDQQLQFDADLDADGAVDQDILYRVRNGDLERSYNGVTTVLVRDLASFDFDFADLNGATLTTPVTGCALDWLRLGRITASATRDAETVSLASAVYLRDNR